MYGEVIAAEPTTIETGHKQGRDGDRRDDRRDRRVTSCPTVSGLGTAIGGVAGGAIGRGPKSKKGWNLVVHLKEGDEVAVQVVGNKETYRAGDKVRLFVKGRRSGRRDEADSLTTPSAKREVETQRLVRNCAGRRRHPRRSGGSRSFLGAPASERAPRNCPAWHAPGPALPSPDSTSSRSWSGSSSIWPLP